MFITLCVNIINILRCCVHVSHCLICFCFRRINHMAINHLHSSSDVCHRHDWHNSVLHWYKVLSMRDSCEYLTSLQNILASKNYRLGQRNYELLVWNCFFWWNTWRQFKSWGDFHGIAYFPNFFTFWAACLIKWGGQNAPQWVIWLKG